MRVMKPMAFIDEVVDYDAILGKIESAGRVCYKSEDKIAPESAEKFIRNVIARGHEAVIEHASITARFICDRGVSHEIVRHRLSSYCQESTRYCNYADDKFGNEITVISPIFFESGGMGLYSNSIVYTTWIDACKAAEAYYFKLINEYGATPQQARAVLPNSLKTEVVMTANLREWRHFFKLRCAPAAHPQMREVALELLEEMKEKLPVFFEDLNFTKEA